jgi:hypothetical protein
MSKSDAHLRGGSRKIMPQLEEAGIRLVAVNAYGFVPAMPSVEAV